MQFKNIALTAASAATVSAQTPIGQTFGVLSIHSGSPVQYAGWSASSRGIFNLGPAQNASCDKGAKEEFATFHLNDKSELFLYSTGNPVQQVYVDRSGMGQGIVGYTTGVEPTPRNAERAGFSIEDGHLKFDGADFQSCPGYVDGAYKIWLAGTSNPGGNSDCVAVAARVQTLSEPVGCLYQQQ
ncbi:uncharacterized protein PG998_004688 [Apiospora kogelbergensis]|uniref:uncharacterized protein n=1 Tax=Apiospora kogelbergensis TaxID=1337665 RepID=UPI00312F7FBB